MRLDGIWVGYYLDPRSEDCEFPIRARLKKEHQAPRHGAILSTMKHRSIALAVVLLSVLSATASSVDQTVYATKEGKKYHTKNCRLKHGSVGIKLSVAKKKGLLPCAVCKPPKS